MKSSSYYTRKAADLRECGHWTMADEYAVRAAKARRIEKAKKQGGKS